MRLPKCLLLFLLVVPTCLGVFSQHEQKEEPPSLVKWLTFKEAFELNKTHPRPFLIDVYTDWCGWCKHMMKTTYSNPDIASYINSWFYAVKFDAETHDTIEYLGATYFNESKAAKSTHQLALKLLGNQLMYPTTIFANYSVNYVLNSQGYLDNKKIEPILVYTLENIFRTTPYEEFSKLFEKTFYDTTKAKVELKWYTFKQAVELNKKHPKKLIVDIYTNWCNGCRVMNKTTFSDSLNVEYLNKNFYLVDFNAEIKDTINYKGRSYVNDGTNGTPFHQLAMELVKNNIALPSTIVIDEGLQPVDVVPQYLSPRSIAPILRFYGSNAYKIEKWEDYLKNYTSGSAEKRQEVRKK